MRIGIDIDGVLTDLEQYQFDYGSKFAFEKNKEKILNINGYEVSDIYEINSNEYGEFWDRYFLDYVVNEKPRKFADEITKKLHEDGNIIYIITARYFTDNDKKRAGGNIEEVVSNWLKNNNIYFDEIIFSPEDKSEICNNNKIEIMIEDSPHNINNLSKSIPVICFDAKYNKDCIGPNIIRCYSWYDIYAKIKHMYNKEGE